MNRRDFIYAASVGAASATMPTMTIAQGNHEGNRESTNDAPQVGAKLRTITLEEHFASPGWFAGPGQGFIEQLRNTGAAGERILEQLQDVGDTRIAEMDAAGIDIQVLSLNSPGVEQPTWRSSGHRARVERVPRGRGEEKPKALGGICHVTDRGT